MDWLSVLAGLLSLSRRALPPLHFSSTPLAVVGVPTAVSATRRTSEALPPPWSTQIAGQHQLLGIRY
jgi:hypothetical protein